MLVPEKTEKEPGRAFVSTALFDNQTKVLHDQMKAGTVRPIMEKEYYIRRCSALLDAMGKAIHHSGNIHKFTWTENGPEYSFFVIITDGMENATCHYSAQRSREKCGWEFLFL